MAEDLTKVSYWQGWPGPAGYIDIPNWSLYPVLSTVSPASLTEGTSVQAYLLKLTVPDLTNKASNVTKVLWPAASFGRSTASNDIPANTYVPGALLDSTINFSIKLFSGIEPESQASGGFGAIVLLDPRGQLDSLINESWDGAVLEILRGPAREMFSNYVTVGKLTTAGILYDQRRKEIRLRDQAHNIQQAGLHDQIYKGTGGLEGPNNLKGIHKPYGVGVCFNIEPIIVDPPVEIRQLSFTKIASVDQVRDGGQVLASTSRDYATYDELKVAATNGQIPPGQYSTCLNSGLIALGAKPVHHLTADFKGDAAVINGTGYTNTLAGILRRIATGYGDVKLTDTDLDFTALEKLSQTQGSVCGYWWKSHTTKADAFKLLMNGRLGWWAVRMNGLLSFGIMENPSGTPALIINYPNDFSGEPRQLDTYQVPRKETFVSYRKNYAVQDASDLAGATIDAGLTSLYGQEFSYEVYRTTDPLWFYPTAQSIYVDSGLANQVDAYTEAYRQQIIMGVRRERWSIQVPISPFNDVLGKVVQINNFPRYGWPASRLFICVGVNFASKLAVTLDLWG